MKNRRSTKLYTTYASIMLIVILLSVTGAFLSTSNAVLETDSVTGAIWTSDPDGERVNGNLYTNAKKVYLAGGPHKEGSASLPDGDYYFQVTDPAGETLLSTDSLADRMFKVEFGYITSSNPPGTHDSNDDTTRGYGVVVQLYPFKYVAKTGGVYKVWVTHVDHYTSLDQGCFGFISSLSKTDNFKVGQKLGEVPKFFELWVTESISAIPDVEFYVNYTTDADGTPVEPWTKGRLIYDPNRIESGYDVFRYETTFAEGTSIYWKFFMLNTLTWTSEIYGPELIDEEGMVNKEILFLVKGHKYDYRDWQQSETLTGLEGWTIKLSRDGDEIAQTLTGPEGEYELLGVGTGDYMVCEVVKRDEGWTNATPPCYEFTVDDTNGGDYEFDFFNYKVLRISQSSEYRCELSSFEVVFTPSNEEPDMYKLSSTNPGSFYYNVVKFGTPGGDIRFEITLPENNTNYDLPNFILHHTYIGSTPEVDIHVYAERQGTEASSCGSEWVPKWSSDITDDFFIDPSEDGKYVEIEGKIPSTGEVFVTLHIDYQISASLTWEQVQSLSNLEYTFSVTVHYSIEGITFNLPIRGGGY